MSKEVLLKIHTVQMVPGQLPEVMELQTEGTLRKFPDHVEISYVESQMTGLEGVETCFAIYGEEKVVLTRRGEKLNNEMVFVLGENRLPLRRGLWCTAHYRLRQRNQTQSSRGRIPGGIHRGGGAHHHGYQQLHCFL